MHSDAGPGEDSPAFCSEGGKIARGWREKAPAASHFRGVGRSVGGYGLDRAMCREISDRGPYSRIDRIGGFFA